MSLPPDLICLHLVTLILLLGLVPCIIATCTVMVMLFYRQTLTTTARAIGTCVDAVNAEERSRK